MIGQAPSRSEINGHGRAWRFLVCSYSKLLALEQEEEDCCVLPSYAHTNEFYVDARHSRMFKYWVPS